MNAIITNMLEERAKRVFKDWTRPQLEDRITVVAQFIDGWDNPAFGEMFRQIAFPQGYDPALHPQDNIDLLHAELQRRERNE